MRRIETDERHFEDRKDEVVGDDARTRVDDLTEEQDGGKAKGRRLLAQLRPVESRRIRRLQAPTKAEGGGGGGGGVCAQVEEMTATA